MQKGKKMREEEIVQKGKKIGERVNNAIIKQGKERRGKTIFIYKNGCNF